MIAFAVLALAAIGGCVVLFLKLRDALNNSARERNLARERSMARKRGADADDLSAVGRERRPVRDRNDAYPSRRQADAARRPLQQGRRAPLPGDEDIRTDRPERDMRDMRGFQAKPGMNRAIGDGVRESARRPEDRDIRTDRPGSGRSAGNAGDESAAASGCCKKTAASCRSGRSRSPAAHE